MNQKPIREFNDQTFTPTEAAEWLKELDDRTKSSQEGHNSIDELAAKVKENKTATEAFANGEGKTYATLTNAMAVNPLPSDNTPFRIENTPSTNFDGKYIYLSTENAGYKFVAPIQKILDEPFDYTDSGNGYSGKRIGAELAKKVSYLDVVDSLNGQQVDVPLSANQGRVLKDLVNDKASYVDLEEADGINANFWRAALSINNVDNTADADKDISNPVQAVFTIIFDGIKACKTITQLAFYIRGATDNCTIESIQCVQEF